jgi:site-specific DNA-methyltransferase (adenine-specific)
LFGQSAFQFESWAVSLIGGQPYKSKGGGDSGIDGLLYFKDLDGKFHRIIIEVKGGGYHPKDVRALKAVIDREEAPMGILLALEKPTKGMISEAAALGKWKMPGTRRECPILQIITIDDIFNGKKPDIPDTSETLKKAKREKRTKQQGRLL